jgi:tetratricopeptide (TPR) repeat protein
VIHSILQNLLDENKWAESISYISQLPQPLSDEYLDKLGWCYSRDGKYNDSLRIYDILIEREPSAKYYYAKGYQYYAQKKWTDAVENFLCALNYYSEYLVVKYRLAYSYLQIAGAFNQWTKNEFWKAISQLEDCHKIYNGYDDNKKAINKSTYASICFIHAKAIMSSDKYIDKAIELLQIAHSLTSDDIDTKYELAKAYYLKKDYLRALSELPTLVKPYYIPELKSQILTDMKEYEQSNIVLFEVLRFRKKDYIYQRIANNYLLLSDNENAYKYADLALQMNSSNYKNELLMGTICHSIKMEKTAFNHLNSARTLKQKSFGTDCPEALKLIDAIMSLSSDNPVDECIILKKDERSYNSGVIVKYFQEKGFGFIKDTIDNKQYFFHITNFQSGVEPLVDMCVNFSKSTNSKGTCAVDIKQRS